MQNINWKQKYSVTQPK